jgi:hypothetical protein
MKRFSDKTSSSMCQAIVTKYHGATNTKGSRISATTGAGIRVYVAYDHALNIDQMHAAACEALLAHMGWGDGWVGGETGPGMWAWVRVGKVTHTRPAPHGESTMNETPEERAAKIKAYNDARKAQETSK